MDHRITWLGHSAFRIESGGLTVFIDPFLDGNPKAAMPASAVTAADVVLVTHDHGDHVGGAVDIAVRTGATLVGLFDTAPKYKAMGMREDRILGMNIGGAVEAAGIKVKMVQAMHSSATGCAAGYILTYPDGFCLYHSGDTGLFASMELFGIFHAIDLALLPIDGWFNMDARQAAYACKLLKCRMAVPMHWGTFPILAQSPEPFAAEVRNLAPDTEPVILAVGAPRTFHKAESSGECSCEEA